MKLIVYRYTTKEPKSYNSLMCSITQNVDKKWSKFKISIHLLSTIRPLLTMTFFLGLTPIQDVKINDNPTIRRIRLCPIGILNAIVVIAIYVLVYSISMYNNESFVKYFFRSKVSMIGDALQTVTGFIGIALIYISSIAQQSKLVKTLYIISDAEDRLQELGIRVLHKRTRSYFYSIFSIVHLISTGYVIGSFFLAKNFMNGKNPAAYIMVGFFLQYTIVSSSIVSFLCKANIIKRRFGFLNDLSKVDIRLTSLRVQIHYDNTVKFNYISLAIQLILNLSFLIGSLIILHCIEKYPTVDIYYAFFAPHIFISTIVITFLSVTLTICKRFEISNKILKNMSLKIKRNEIGSTIVENKKKLNCLKSFSLHTITTKLPNEIIQESMEVHFLLCEAANTANKYFTYQLLTILSISFLIIVFDAYYILETCLGRTERDQNFKPVEFVTFFICQMGLYIIAIFAIVEGSVKAVDKSEKTSGIIHTLLNQASDSDTREKLQNFSLQLIHQRVKFTAAGLFNIDRTLYFTITGAITTYLIILLQFSSPAVWVSFLMGIEPFIPGYKKHLLNVFGLFITLMEIISYGIYVLLSLRRGEWLVQYFVQTKITKLSTFLHPITSVIIVYITCLIIILKRKSTVHLIHRLRFVDNNLTSLGIKIDHRKTLKYVWIIMILILLFNTIYFSGCYALLTKSDNQPSFEVIVSYLVPHIQMAMLIQKFEVKLHLILHRMVALNRILNNMLEDLKFKNQNKSINQPTNIHPIEIKKKNSSRSVYRQCTVEIDKVELKIMTIKKAIKIYDLLCDACEIVDDHFTYQMLIIIGISFIYIVFDGYYILVAVLYQTNGSNVGNNDFLIFFCIQMFLYIIIILGIVESVNKTIKQSRLSLTLIHKMLNINDDVEIQDCLRNFSSQIMNRPITFTAAGLFNLDRTLYFTISGATTTYLIVLVQFSSHQSIPPANFPEIPPENNKTVF
ncbi:uncharacterized protein LOC129615139 [Condylostylus longicornis]|uniref:uncharacterized protein LOC129615139 n=1 Tax=Condylostylus longicornis TaxID=2530218 RepID=UPI00244E1AA2|nr:uncharacterized protein LOC129615139 [Condylostylus longicornis]